MNWYFFRTYVFCFFHLSLVKTIVKSAKYPVDNMPSLWKTITLFHKDEVPGIIKLAQYALTLPLHTCSCERVFSNQNLIVTRLRSRLNPKISDRKRVYTVIKVFLLIKRVYTVIKVFLLIKRVYTVIKVFLFKSLFFADIHLFKELWKSCLVIPFLALCSYS
jgi:hypothetical protein